MSHEGAPPGLHAGPEEPAWGQGSAFVIRRRTGALSALTQGAAIRESVASLPATEPEELNTVAGRRLRRLMLANMAAYRNAESAAKLAPVVWVPTGAPVTFQPEMVHGVPWSVALSKGRASVATKSAKVRKGGQGAKAAAIRAALDKHPNASDQHIANITGIPRSTVNRIKNCS